MLRYTWFILKCQSLVVQRKCSCLASRSCSNNYMVWWCITWVKQNPSMNVDTERSVEITSLTFIMGVFQDFIITSYIFIVRKWVLAGPLLLFCLFLNQHNLQALLWTTPVKSGLLLLKSGILHWFVIVTVSLKAHWLTYSCLSLQ